MSIPVGALDVGIVRKLAFLKKGVPSEFEEGMARRRAIYIAFPQAVPLKARVDEESCLLLSKGKCKQACMEACKAEAIDFNQEGGSDRERSGFDHCRNRIRSI